MATITGTSAGETLTGTSTADTISGLDGDDLLKGLGGADTLDGGNGTDTADYSADSTSFGIVVNLTGAGFTGYSGWYVGANQARDGSGAIDTLISIENIKTGNAADEIYGGAGANRIETGGGNDRLDGGAGADTLIGGTGNDSYWVDDAGDSVVEGLSAGTDNISLYNLTSYTMPDNVENLTAYGASASITGNAVANQISGTNGDDTLRGMGGNDTLFASTGTDTLIGGQGNDAYYIRDLVDVLVENSGEGTDTVYLWTAGMTYTLGANFENLSAYSGQAVAANMTGNSVGNTINGEGGADIIDGAGGDDRLSGYMGADTLTGGTGNDLFIYFFTSHSTAAAADTITDFAVGDRIDLSVIDGDGAGTSNAFSFIGSAAFSNVAGELRVTGSGSNWLVEGDTNGDGAADIVINLTTASAYTPVATDFLL
jgi:Ca2+-binding RTX toxin-like protein